ncbi:MAG TPA: type II toxin-antitoxin system VapC family toxin [Mucilaginibacter sp.]|jgi:predicted nucleic acid-binding protein
MYLLDTNAVINYLDAALPAPAMQFLSTVIDENCNISVITKMETLGYAFKSIGEQKTIETFVSGSTVFAINDEIVNKTIAIRKTKKIKLPDAIIAATALVYGFILISRNTADFNNIQYLHVIDPYSRLAHL